MMSTEHSDQPTVRIALNGAMGRMGRAVRECLEEVSGVILAGVWERSEHPDQGRVVPGTALRLGEVLSSSDWDVVVDFSAEDGLLDLVRRFPVSGALVTGVTGVSKTTRTALESLSARAPVFHEPNMSVGVAVLRRVVAKACGWLDDSWDVEVLEMHHRRKVDAPSGTALSLVETIQDHRPGCGDSVMRQQGSAGPRRPGEVGVAVLRGGDVVGEHEVIFAGAGERLRLGHQATSRAVFAAGAIRAARWVVKQGPGLYGMADLLWNPRDPE
jgi:4-hydroxy-tetrahydrodipicolinate reductase